MPICNHYMARIRSQELLLFSASTNKIIGRSANATAAFHYYVSLLSLAVSEGQQPIRSALRFFCVRRTAQAESQHLIVPGSWK